MFFSKVVFISNWCNFFASPKECESSLGKDLTHDIWRFLSQESPAAQVYIKEVISSMDGNNHIALSPVNSNTAISLQPRPSTLKRPTLVAVGGISSTFILDSVDAFSFVRGRCLTCPAMPVNSLMWFSATVAENILIITGGIRVSSATRVMLSGIYYHFFVLRNSTKYVKCLSNILLCIKTNLRVVIGEIFKSTHLTI